MTTPGRSGGGVLGILGGMGPFASAAFLSTLYECAAERSVPFSEQALPRVLLDSDPAFPDRTEAITAGQVDGVREAEVRAAEVREAEVRAAEVREAEVREAEVRAAEVRAAEVREAEVREAEVREAEFTDRLRERVAGLLALGATRVVVTCVTAHHFVAGLSAAERRKLISLVDLVIDELAAVDSDERLLLVATQGARQAAVFERAARWPEVADRVLLPDPDLQETLHRLIYRLKRGPVTDDLVERAMKLAAEHGCTGLVAGCTEVHLLTRALRARGADSRVVDPLVTIAAGLKTLLGE